VVLFIVLIWAFLDARCVPVGDPLESDGPIVRPTSWACSGPFGFAEMLFGTGGSELEARFSAFFAEIGVAGGFLAMVFGALQWAIGKASE
jgi:hypothetical protein